MPLLLAGLVIITLVSCFLAIRGLVRLYQDQELQLAISSTIVFVLLPLIIVVGICFSTSVIANIWLLLPLIAIFIIWVGFGYWLAFYMQKDKQRQMSGLDKEIPARPRHYWRDNLLALIAGISIWVIGNFIDFSRLPILEIGLLCLALFLVIASCVRLWKYRGF